MPDTLPAALRELAPLRPDWVRRADGYDGDDALGYYIHIAPEQEVKGWRIAAPNLGTLLEGGLALAREEGIELVMQTWPDTNACETVYGWAVPGFSTGHAVDATGNDLPRIYAEVMEGMDWAWDACPTTSLLLTITAALRETASPQGGDTP